MARLASSSTISIRKQVLSLAAGQKLALPHLTPQERQAIRTFSDKHGLLLLVEGNEVTKSAQGPVIPNADSIDQANLNVILNKLERTAEQSRERQQAAARQLMRHHTLNTKVDRTPSEQAEFDDLDKPIQQAKQLELAKQEQKQAEVFYQQDLRRLYELRSAFRTSVYFPNDDFLRLRLDRWKLNALFEIVVRGWLPRLLSDLDLPPWIRLQPKEFTSLESFSPRTTTILDQDGMFTVWFAMTEENRLEYIAKHPYKKPEMDMSLATERLTYPEVAQCEPEPLEDPTDESNESLE
jgi:exonuclease VII large subunit